jgi:hypothetical protein
MQNLFKFDDNDNVIEPPYALYKSYRIAIYVKRYDSAKNEYIKTRTVVELQGYLLTALCYKKGIDKTQVPKAIQALIDFEKIDGKGRVTNQVEMLIVDAIM